MFMRACGRRAAVRTRYARRLGRRATIRRLGSLTRELGAAWRYTVAYLRSATLPLVETSMSKWEKRKILILGKTYPNYSRKYLEVACTGGLLEPTMEMIRLYPIRFRYLEDASKFVAWQYIEAEIKKDLSDPRPESYNVRDDSIEPLDFVPSTEAERRCHILEQSPHFFRSVEELLIRNKEMSTSLGTIRPAEILGTSVRPRDEGERDEWELKEQEILAQKTLIGPDPKKIDFPEAKFFVKWRCDDPSCTKQIGRASCRERV